MTETLDDPLPPPPPNPPTPPPSAERRLERDPDDQVVAGVCAALGRYTDTDPVLWRVSIGVLTVFGGAGLVLYVLGWLLIPRTGAPLSFVERTLRGADRPVAIAGVALLSLLALALLALLDLEGPTALALLVVGGVVLLATRERRAGGPRGPQPQAWAPAGPASSYGVPPGHPGSPAAPRPPRERSALGPVTLSAATLLAGLLLLLRELGVAGITGPRVLAATILVVGAGLVVGTWLGRARWLLAVGLVLTALLVPVAALDGRLAGGAGERTWTPAAGDPGTDYRLGAGEATLDLRDVGPGTVAGVRARVGLGRLVVLVPERLRVRVRPEVGVGTLLRTGQGGRSTQESDPFTDEAYEDLLLGPAGERELVLDAEVGFGELEVRRVSS